MLLVAGAAGCFLSAGAQQTATLRGMVVNAETHQPVARVLVESPTGGAGVLTDSAGRFSFAAVPLGPVQLRYRRPGYFGSDLSTQASTFFSFATDSAEQVLLLEPAAAVHGQVLLADGDLPDNLRVDLYQAQVTDGRRSWRLSQTVTTAADGSFAVNDLVPGSYLAHAQAAIDSPPAGRRGDTSAAQVRSGYAPQFAPGTGDRTAATVYVLRPGQTADVRLRLTRVPFYPVHIHVAGEGTAGSLTVTGNGFSNWTPRYQRGDDMVATELPAGSYLLRATGNGRPAAMGELPFHVDAAAASSVDSAAGSGLTLVLIAAPAMQVETRVMESSGANTQGGEPRISTLTLIPLGSSGDQPITESVQYDEGSSTGTLRLGVPPGQYWVAATASGGYVAALTSGGVDLLSQPLTVAPGTAPTFLASIGQDGGTLTVTRAGELLSQPATLQLLPLSPGGLSQMRSIGASATQDAASQFENLAPGDYLVLATASHQAIAFREPGVLQQLRGEHVTVAAGGTAQVTLSAVSTVSSGAAGSL